MFNKKYTAIETGLMLLTPARLNKNIQPQTTFIQPKKPSNTLDTQTIRKLKQAERAQNIYSYTFLTQKYITNVVTNI